MRTVGKHILLMFVLLSSVYAANLPTGALPGYANMISDILQKCTNAYIAVTISLLVSALLYMGYSIFSDAKMLAMAKDVFYQAIVSLVLIASLPVLYVVISNLLITLFFGDMQLNVSYNDMFDISKIYLAWNEVYFFLHLLLVTSFNMVVSNLINQTYSIPIGGKLVPLDFASVAKPIMYALGFGVNILTTALLINSFQIMFLNFIQSALLPVLLPIGVLLRAFPSSMNAGNILIAICIGGYIITPAVFLFDLYLLKTLLDPASKNKTYERLGYMGLFYNITVIEAIIDSTKCPILSDLVNKVVLKDYSVLNSKISDDLSSKCNINIGMNDVLNIYSQMPTWAKFAVGATVVSKVSMSISSVLSLMGKAPSPSSKLGGLLKKGYIVFSTVGQAASLSLGIIFAIQSVEIMESIGISFIILAVILPFINFTIIVLFMRELSQTVLGTPLNLGHLVRLL